MKNPMATILMEDGAEILVELHPLEAPNTVNSFIHIANSGWYDGQSIQRIVPGYVIQPSYTCFGLPQCDYMIPSETTGAGFPNHIKMDEGVIAMGGAGEAGTSGSEFFFPLGGFDRLEGNFPAFGRVTKGWEEIKRWESVPLEPVPCDVPGIRINRPITPIVIRQIRVETFGQDYPPPVKLPKA